MPNQAVPDTTLLSLRQLSAMLYARRRTIVATAAAVLALTVAVLLLTPKSWTASAELYIDYKENDPIGGRAFSAMLDDSYMQTQISMLRSRIVAERVADRLGLTRTAQYQEAVQALGETRAHDALITSINERTETAGSRASRVVEISFTDRDPAIARDVANALVDAYVSLSQELASSSARSRSEQYQLQLEQLRGEAESLQQKITTYQRETGILDQQDNLDVAQREFTEMSGALMRLRAREQETESRNRVVEQMMKGGMRADELPEIANLLPVADLKARLNGLSEQIETRRAVLGANHPTLRGLIEERDQIQARLRRAGQAALEAQRNELASLRLQRAAQEQAVATQRAQLLQNMQQRDQLSAYRRQLASAEQVYGAALQKYDGLLMASNITQPNVTSLRAAELPSAPSKPRVRQSLMLGLVAGVVAGLCLALLLELRQRRVRCEDDVARGMSLPLLGRVGAPDVEMGI